MRKCHHGIQTKTHVDPGCVGILDLCGRAAVADGGEVVRARVLDDLDAGLSAAVVAALALALAVGVGGAVLLAAGLVVAAELGADAGLGLVAADGSVGERDSEMLRAYVFAVWENRKKREMENVF